MYVGHMAGWVGGSVSPLLHTPTVPNDHMRPAPPMSSRPPPPRPALLLHRTRPSSQTYTPPITAQRFAHLYPLHYTHIITHPRTPLRLRVCYPVPLCSPEAYKYTYTRTRRGAARHDSRFPIPTRARRSARSPCIDAAPAPPPPVPQLVSLPRRHHPP